MKTHDPYASFPDHLHPAKNFTPRKNPPKPEQPQLEAITAAELEKLEGMSHEELITLVERLARQCGLVAMMTPEETYQAGMDRLAALMLKLPDSQAKEISTIFDRWADRYKGKPAMSINQNVTLTLEQLVLSSYNSNAPMIDAAS